MNAYSGGRGPAFDEALALLTQDDPPPPSAEDIRRREDRTELTRRAKASFLGWAENSPEADPLEVQAARDFLAATAPLQRPLGTGEPCLPSCTPDLCRASPDGFCDEGAA